MKLSKCSFIHSFCTTFDEYYNKLSYNISSRFAFFDYDKLLNSLYHIELLYSQHFCTDFDSDCKCELLSDDELLLFIKDYIHFIVNNFTSIEFNLDDDSSIPSSFALKFCTGLLESVKCLEEFYYFIVSK